MALNTINPFDEIMDTDDVTFASSPSHILRDIALDIFPCKTLLDAIRYILCNSTHQTNHATLTVDQEQIFEIIEHLHQYPHKMFMYLRKHFAKHFDIDLQIIAFDNGTWSLINQDTYDKRNMAFLSFSEDNTICGPLYTVNDAGMKETIFSIDNTGILFDVYMYMTQLNDRKLLNDFLPIQGQQSVSRAEELIEDPSIGNISPSTNEFNRFNSVQTDDKTQSRIMLDQMFQQLFRVFDGLPVDPYTLCQVLQPFVSHITTFKYLSSKDSIMASKDGISYLSQLVQIAEQSLPIYQNEQVGMPLQLIPSSDINSEPNQATSDIETFLSTPLPSVDLITTADNANSTVETPMNVLNDYDPPTLIKLLKDTFHPRTLDEFATTGSSPVRCVYSNQRDPLQIEVPPDNNISLYLAMELVDSDGRTHPSKFIVPDKTKAENESLINNNDLRCLNFSKCHKDHIFDRDTKRLYSKISPEERRHLQKKIRIHMISLYQRGETKKAAKNPYFKKCRLAFWLCILENGEYKPVSRVSYSNITEERMTSTKKKKIGT